MGNKEGRKGRIVAVRVGDKLYERLEEGAQNRGIGVSTYARFVLLEAFGGRLETEFEGDEGGIREIKTEEVFDDVKQKETKMDVRDGSAEDVEEWLNDRSSTGRDVSSGKVLGTGVAFVEDTGGVEESIDYKKIILDAINDETPDNEMDYKQLNVQGRRLLKNRYWKLAKDKADDKKYEDLAKEFHLVKEEVDPTMSVNSVGRDDSRAKETARLSKKAAKSREVKEPIGKKDSTYWKGKKRKKK